MWTVRRGVQGTRQSLPWETRFHIVKGQQGSQFVIILTNFIVTVAKKSIELEIKRFISRVSLIPVILGKSFHVYGEMVSVYSSDRRG